MYGFVSFHLETSKCFVGS